MVVFCCWFFLLTELPSLVDTPHSDNTPTFKQEVTYLGVSLFPYINTPEGGKWNKAFYLCDEDSVLLHQVIVVVTPCQQLPDLSSQGLRDTTSHQCWQCLWPHAQIEVPGVGEGFVTIIHAEINKQVNKWCAAPPARWQEREDAPQVVKNKWNS